MQASNPELRLELRQVGPTVNGYLRLLSAGTSGDMTAPAGPLEGTVAGDVFTFTRVGGATLAGEMTVAGDEMTGRLTGRF